MYQNKPNAIQRARISKGLTQEALAGRCGYSDDTIRAWESGARTASLEALSILSECLEAPWLTGVYLREQTNALNELIPAFTVGRPLAAAEWLRRPTKLTMRCVLQRRGHNDNAENANG